MRECYNEKANDIHINFTSGWFYEFEKDHERLDQKLIPWAADSLVCDWHKKGGNAYTLKHLDWKPMKGASSRIPKGADGFTIYVETITNVTWTLNGKDIGYVSIPQGANYIKFFFA